MRCLLDTCIMLYMLNKTGEMSDDVEAIVSDYGVEHTQSFEDVVDDLAQYCHKNGGALI